MDKLLSISGASNQTRKSRLFMLYLNKLKNSQGPRNLTFFFEMHRLPQEENVPFRFENRMQVVANVQVTTC